jgi:PAS domain-containing protein
MFGWPKKANLYRLAVAGLSLNALIALNSLGTLHSGIDSLLGAQAALAALADTSLALEADESAFLALLMSDWKEALTSRLANSDALRSRLDNLERAVLGEPSQAERLAGLRYALGRREVECRELYQLRLTGGVDKAAGAFAGGRGRQTRAEIRRLLGAMEAEETRRHGGAVADSLSALGRALVTFALSSGVSLALLGSVVFLSRRELAHRARADAAVRRSQEWLAAMVSGISDAVIATDERGRIRLLNPVAQALTGWGPARPRGCRSSRSSP